MPLETGLWRIQDTGLVEAQKDSLQSEADLHKWIEDNPKLVSSDLLLIGSEVVTGSGARIDLLGIDSSGTVHIIELKRGKTPRDVVAQALDYASWVVTLLAEDLERICLAYKNMDLATAYQERFSGTLPETLNDEHSITIVASALDAPSERIVKYLSEYHGLNINAVFFTVFNDGGNKVLTRTWLIDPEKVNARSEERADVKGRGDWTGYYFVNIGVVTSDNSWEDDRKYGFVNAGGGARFRRYMQKLRPGDKIFAYAKGQGYVGYGIVTAPAVMAKDFRTPDGTTLLGQDLKGTELRKYVDDEELAEYVVAVDWQVTVDLSHAKTRAGIFRIQQVVNPIYDTATTDFLRQQFGLT